VEKMMRIEFEIEVQDPAVLPLRQAWESAARRHEGRHEALAARALDRYQAISAGAMPGGVRESLSVIPSLARLLADPRWRPAPDAREHFAGALAYFVDPDDLIPDDGGHFGYLDDALVLKLALAEMRHEWFAWCDYSDYVAAHPAEAELDREGWMQRRRERLELELRRRNEGGYRADGRRDPGFAERYAPAADAPARFGVR
jgi:uncharacterized membrane protein YkvA (DUF1232 family)